MSVLSLQFRSYISCFFMKSVVLKLSLWITRGHQDLHGGPQIVISIPPSYHPSQLPTHTPTILPQPFSPMANLPHAVLILGPPNHLLSSAVNHHIGDLRLEVTKEREVAQGSFKRVQALIRGQGQRKGMLGWQRTWG